MRINPEYYSEKVWDFEADNPRDRVHAFPFILPPLLTMPDVEQKVKENLWVEKHFSCGFHCPELLPSEQGGAAHTIGSHSFCSAFAVDEVILVLKQFVYSINA